MKKIQKGFTLIELMIVVAIIGILAAVAIPAYQDYIVKAKLTKVQSTIDPIKLALALYYQEQGTFPNGSVTTTGTDIFWTSIGLPSGVSMPPEVDTTSTNFKVDGTIGTGTKVDITLMFANIKAGSINGKSIVIEGSSGPTAINWACISSATGTDKIVTKYFVCP